MVEFGEQLRKAREGKGMTQQTLADMLFVSRTAVSRWECGERFPDLLTTKKIAEILGVSLDNLLSGKDISMEVERNPVVENKTAHNIMIALYAFVLFSCLIVIAFNIINYLLIYTIPFGFTLPDGAKAELIGYVNVVFANFVTKQIIPIIKTVMQIAVFAFGFYQAIKDTLSPKMTGRIIVMYLALTSLMSFMQMLITFAMNSSWSMGYAIATFCIFLIPPISGAVLAYFLFIRRSNVKIVPTMIIFISVLEVILNLGYTIFWIKYAIGEADSYYSGARFLYNGDYGVRVSYTINNVLVLFTDVAIYGLIVFQTVALWIKRKKVEAVTNSESEIKEAVTE